MANYSYLKKNYTYLKKPPQRLLEAPPPNLLELPPARLQKPPRLRLLGPPPPNHPEPPPLKHPEPPPPLIPEPPPLRLQTPPPSNHPTTTTAAPGTTTTADPDITTTAAPGTNTTTTTAPRTTTTASSVISPGLCKNNSCSSDASCVELNNKYFCLCIDGYYYNSSTCKKGKVFPGTIKVNVSETSDLQDEKSMAYENLYMDTVTFVSIFQPSFLCNTESQSIALILRWYSCSSAARDVSSYLVHVPICQLDESQHVEEGNVKGLLFLESPGFSRFKGTFANSDFGQTVIHKVRIPASARSEMRAGYKLVDVTVVNLFAENSKENEMTVSSAIKKAIENNRDNFTDYATQDRCDFYGCEKANDQDDCRDFLQCKCKPGLSRPNPQTALCLALGPKCPDNCNAEHNMQCLVRSGGSPECVCLSGYQKDAQGSCQACPFGYSGVNCEDELQLILTIVGTIAGILILGMAIALIILRSKKNKDVEEQNLIENNFLRMRTTGFTNLGAEGSIFPKVRITLQDGPLQNSYWQDPYLPRSMPRPDY
ncbi:mucin-13 [Pipistrellus kuhlii]|uniref:mucin-13 n=1 Tax=Pipistrellus kuhlii TaxID=59472 RepID=UPI001E27463D|nr:mucin-13 [Pipistrellus kuhlii]